MAWPDGSPAWPPPPSGGGLPVLELDPPTYTTPSAGDYVIGGYHDFDGVDERIDFGRITACEVTTGSEWTVSLWAKRTGSQNVFFSIADAQNRIVIYENTTNQLAVNFRLANQNYNVSRNSVLLSDWVHIFVISDGSDLSLYIDGSLVAFNSTSGTYPTATQTWTASTRVRIGAISTGFYASAQIAEVAMWSTDQSANVAAIYNSRARHDLMDLTTPPDLFYAPLTSYGDDPGSGGSVAELVANNDGSGVNMETADAVIPTPTTVTSTLTKALDIATSVVTSTKVEEVPSGGGGTGSSFP